MLCPTKGQPNVPTACPWGRSPHSYLWPHSQRSWVECCKNPMVTPAPCSVTYKDIHRDTHIP